MSPKRANQATILRSEELGECRFESFPAIQREVMSVSCWPYPEVRDSLFSVSLRENRPSNLISQRQLSLSVTIVVEYGDTSEDDGSLVFLDQGNKGYPQHTAGMSFTQQIPGHQHQFLVHRGYADRDDHTPAGLELLE